MVLDGKKNPYRVYYGAAEWLRGPIFFMPKKMESKNPRKFWQNPLFWPKTPFSEGVSGFSKGGFRNQGCSDQKCNGWQVGHQKTPKPLFVSLKWLHIHFGGFGSWFGQKWSFEKGVPKGRFSSVTFPNAPHGSRIKKVKTAAESA